jgi:lipopolysaccharide transport protein LptA
MKFTHLSIALISLICGLVSWHFLKYTPHFATLDKNKPTALTTHLEEVHFSKQNRWTIKADQSELYKEKQIIQLNGHVNLIQPSNTQQPGTNIHTDHATLHTNTKQLTTDAQVKIDHGKTHIQGIGATANMNTGALTLLAKSVGHYVNEQTKKTAQTNTTPTDISSNQLTYNNSTHQATYIGHVIATQPLAKLRSEKMVITLDPNTHNITHMVATGSPATYQRINPVTHLTTHAHGDTIIYDPQHHHILLQKNATIIRNGNKIQAPYIIYNTMTDTAYTPHMAPRGQPTHITVAPQIRSHE